jgi:hypothetical protein
MEQDNKMISSCLHFMILILISDPHMMDNDAGMSVHDPGA